MINCSDSALIYNVLEPKFITREGVLRLHLSSQSGQEHLTKYEIVGWALEIISISSNPSLFKKSVHPIGDHSRLSQVDQTYLYHVINAMN